MGGLRRDDLLVGAGGAPVRTLDDLQRAMVLGHRSGEAGRLAVELVRGERREICSLQPRPERAAA